MSVWLSIGWHGWGVSAGLFPEIRLGFIAFGCCRGALRQRIVATAESVAAALRAFRIGA